MSLSVEPPQVRSARPHWLAFPLALLWITVFGCYWWEYVPLRPESTFVVEQGKRFEGLSPAGEMMFSQSDQPRYSSILAKGPIEFRTLPEGRLVRTAFQKTDGLKPRFHSPDGRTVIRRDGAFWLATLSGAALHRLPGLTGNQIRSSTIKGNRLLWQDETGVVLYDIDEQREIVCLTSSPRETWNVIDVADDIAVLYVFRDFPNDAGERQTEREWKLISLSSGEMDSRFSDLDGHLAVSPDDRFVVLLTDHQKITVFDRQTAAPVWSKLTGDITGRRFEDQGQILALDRPDRSGKLSVSRWRVADGTPIGATTLADPQGRRRRDLGPIVQRHLIDGSQYAIDVVSGLTPKWKFRMVDLSRELGRWTGARSLPPAQEKSQSIMFDVSRDRPVGLLAEEGVEIVGTPDGRLLVQDEVPKMIRLRCYQLPPGRYWSWFLQRAIVPPLILFTLIWIRSRWRTQKV
jgi:hypothetical protein